MPGQLDILERLWPDRGVFQGAATAYLRYCEKPDTAWHWFEQPLWQDFLANLSLPEAAIMDMGAGGGKIIGLLIEQGAKEENILALEPNVTMLDYLQKKFPGVGRIKGSVADLGHEFMKEMGNDLLVANMLVNHLSTPEFNRFVLDTYEMLLPGGMLAYTIPEPHHKAVKHGIDYQRTTAVVEEAAPWGGIVKYHHRSIEYQVAVLSQAGYSVDYRSGGHDDSDHFRQGPKRVLIIAQKP